MAILGQGISGAIESGFTRFDDSDPNFSYEGVYEHRTGYCWNNTYIWWTANPGGKIKFNFSGTSLYLYQFIFNDRASNMKITIDNSIVETFNQSWQNSNTSNLSYMKTGLENRVHNVVIENLSSGIMTFDAVDVNGSIYPYTATVNKYLAKTIDGKYWSNKTGSWIDLGMPADDAAALLLLQNSGSYFAPTQAQLIARQLRHGTQL